ncbi:MAG: polysaccharide deacetylase family protein [Acidobacteria bacterium]|nr:polysaccharide deacetylase family protein [Acidobacteriota bacterium]
MWIELLLLLALIALVTAVLASALPLRRRSFRITVSLVVSTVLVVYGAWTLSRARWQLVGETSSAIDTPEKLVALTFDDGPTREWTAPVLSILEREGARATFFLIGASADANPAEARAIVAAGHEVGNHSYTHRRMILCSPAFVRAEVERTDEALRRAGWHGPLLFRSPYCKKLVVLPYYLARNGRVNVFWDVDADSTSRFTASPEQLASHVVGSARPGSVVLMHVMYDGRQVSRDALPLIIRGLRGRGFELVTVSELMRRGQ